MSKVSIAVIGLNGLLGKPVLTALTSPLFAGKVDFPIKALTRNGDAVSTEQIKYIQADLSQTSTIAEQLKGTDVIIELLGPNPETFGNVEKIVTAVKPKLFIPSQFGVITVEAQKISPGFLEFKLAHSKTAREAGIKTVDIATNFFTAPGSWTHEIAGHYGIDGAKNAITQLTEPTTKVSLSTFPDIGKTVAAVATYPKPSELPDLLRVHSEAVTFQQVWDNWAKIHGVKLEVTSKKSAAEAEAELKADLAASGYDLRNFLHYYYVIAAQGGPATYFAENERELVNPGESLWKWDSFV